MTTEITFTNHTDLTRILAFEPWAHAYEVGPGDRAQIVCEAGNPRIEFSLERDGAIYVSVYAAPITITAGGHHDTFPGPDFDDDDPMGQIFVLNDTDGVQELAVEPLARLYRLKPGSKASINFSSEGPRIALGLRADCSLSAHVQANHILADVGDDHEELKA